MVSGDPPAPIEERYAAAVDVLAALHGQELPSAIPVAPQVVHSLPAYDLDAYLIEAELLLDWYLPRLGVAVRDEVRAGLRGAVDARRCRRRSQAAPTWVLRDFHSPNLIWLPERAGHRPRRACSTSRTR